MSPRPYPTRSTLTPFAGALERLDGDVELLRKMATFFLADSPPLLAELNALWEAGESGDAMAFTAHKLKGLVVTFDDVHAGPLLQDLVDAAREGDAATVAMLRGPVNRGVDQLQRNVRAFAEG